MLSGTTRNPYHLDALSPHFITAAAYQTPILYTTDMSFCIAIGMISRKNGSVQRMGIYHSYSEHGPCSDEFIRHALESSPEQRMLLWDGSNFIRAIRDFLQCCESGSAVRMIIHVNENYAEFSVDEHQPEKSYNYQMVKNLVNQVSAIIEKSQISDFQYSKGGSFFCLMNDGNSYADFSRKEIMARQIAIFIHDHIAARVGKSRYFFAWNIAFMDGTTKKGTWLDRTIIAHIHQSHEGKSTWMEACLHIFNELQKLPPQEKPDIFSKENNNREEPAGSYQRYKNMLEFICIHHYKERYNKKRTSQ
jgi:hypothetical protein